MGERSRAEVWVIVSAALDLFVGLHARRLGPIAREAREDLVAEKASDLMRSIEEGRWRPDQEPVERIASFVSSTARNGLVDHLRRSSTRSAVEESPGEAFDFESMPAGPEYDPATHVARDEFVEALRQCVAVLPERDRRVWRLRVLHEMRTREIADHPEVRLSPANVDVILYRVRAKVRDCMAHRGLDRVLPPPGTFARLWSDLTGVGTGERSGGEEGETP